eukprot:Opistho-2@25266
MASTEREAAAVATVVLERARKESVAINIVEIACPTSPVQSVVTFEDAAHHGAVVVENGGGNAQPAVIPLSRTQNDEGEEIITDPSQLPTYINQWTLTFRCSEIETEYRRARLPLLLRTIRLCLWCIFVVVWVLFFAAYFNLWASEKNDTYRRISFLYIVGTGIALALQLLSYTPWFKRRLHLYTYTLLVPCAILLGALLFVPRGIADEGAVSSALILALIGFVLSMERFLITTTILLSYVGAFVIQVLSSSNNNTSQFVQAIVPLVAVSFFPCLAAHKIDKRSRELWLAQRSVDDRNKSLSGEKEQMERLLKFQLPESIIAKLKGGESRRAGSALSYRFDAVTVAFVELSGWHDVMHTVEPADAVAILNAIFTRFDTLVEQSGNAIEKIKTTGSMYMVASGVPNPVGDHACAVAEWALRLLADWKSGKTKHTADSTSKWACIPGRLSAGSSVTSNSVTIYTATQSILQAGCANLAL